MRFVFCFALVFCSLLKAEEYANIVINTFAEDDLYRNEEVIKFENNIVSGDFDHLNRIELKKLYESLELKRTPLIDYYFGALSFNNGFLSFQELLEKLTQYSDNDLTVASINLGDIYYFGYGNIAINKNKAIEFYKKTIRPGASIGHLRLGNIFLNDSDFLDLGKAKEHFLASLAHNQPEAAFNLGLIFWEYEKNNKDALIHFVKAGQLGYPRGYFNAYVVSKNMKFEVINENESLRYLRYSAEGGYLQGQYFWGKYLIDSGLFEDAVVQLTLASDKSFLPATELLSKYYSSRIDSYDSLKIAEMWLVKSVEQGSSAALHNLKSLYREFDEVAPGFKKQGEKVLSDLKKIQQ